VTGSEPADRKSILLRLDPSVHDALAHWAADELRSTNAQIEFILWRALVDTGRALAPRPTPKRGPSERGPSERGRAKRGRSERGRAKDATPDQE
jgi:hypothetical protein